jgi:hypothetical protein
MSPTLITVLVLGVLIIIAVIAFALYKTGFTLDKLKVKLGMVEAEASRKPKTIPDTKEAALPTGTKIRRRVTEGGSIKKSGITAPADSAAEIDEQAKGKKSKIDDSPIKLT